MRLIDADNAISVCEILSEKGDNPHYWDQLISIIEDIPTVDAALVVHGRWIEHDGPYECCVCHNISCCKGDYCPDCGARMDGGENDAE